MGPMAMVVVSSALGFGPLWLPEKTVLSDIRNLLPVLPADTFIEVWSFENAWRYDPWWCVGEYTVSKLNHVEVM